MLIQQTNFIRVTAANRKNCCPGKPNEDAYWAGAASQVFCVADGITRSRGVDGSYPNPSPASDVAEIVVSAIASAFDRPDSSPKVASSILEALRNANRDIDNYIKWQTEGGRSFTDDIPGAVATVLALENSYATFVHLGDCVAMFLPQGDLSRGTRLTVDQTAAARRWRMSSARSMAPEEQMRFVRNSIRNVVGHPLGFGALCGEPSAFEFAQTGRVRTTAGDAFLLCTDGLEGTLARILDDVHLQELIRRRDVEGILDHTEELDFTLGRRSDDKTIMIIDLLA